MFICIWIILFQASRFLFKLESMKALPAGELGELNRLLVNRVKAFSKQDVRDAIQNNRLDSVDSDLYVVLTQYLEE